jgi:hypothetical protein
MLGSLECSTDDNRVFTSVSGFTDAERESLWMEKDKLIGRIIEVKHNGFCKGKDTEQSLLHAVVARDKDKNILWRDDRDTTN